MYDVAVALERDSEELAVSASEGTREVREAVGPEASVAPAVEGDPATRDSNTLLASSRPGEATIVSDAGPVAVSVCAEVVLLMAVVGSEVIVSEESEPDMV